ncbi:family 16 glycosylhydrolase [uncultured Gilvimarinus sp.]|uniref:family 16 glycosylhydrolase n=1 Tax=uncultured Gilvimarinus sp. TaxID=1689143 RepID=UPI0030D7FF5A
MVWSDEFEGSSIDSSKWAHEVNCWGGGNNEQQCYTDRADNSYVQDGKLFIVARQESFSGPAVNNEDPSYDPADTSATMPYTSARLRTRDKADWTYGRMEINAKLPQGDGLWPAIWMLPTDSKYGGWPLSGEIDIMEAVNPNAGGANEVYGTLHYGRVWPNNLNTGSDYSPPANVWDEFHTYAVEWEQGEIRWYVDDVHFATHTQDDWFTYYWGGQEQGFQLGTDDAPFDQNFHMLLNVAVGGNWPGAPDGSASFPQTMEVDYVRVYECSANPTTGKGCATIDPSAKDVAGVAPPTAESYDLYNGGATSFTFSTVDGEVTNTLVPGFYDNNTGNVISDPQGMDANGNTVWDIEFNGPGNAFLTTGDMSAYPEVNDGLKFTNVAEYGELRFKMLVEAIDPATELHIKLDSGWPNVSFHTIDTPAVGEWTEVAVAINELSPNNIETGEANLGQLINAFVIEASGGTAHVQLADIQLGCLSPCGVDPVLAAVSDTLTDQFTIFKNGVPGANWDFGVGSWDNNSGHVTAQTATDPDRGDVLDILFDTSGNNGLAFIQSTTPKNGRAFATNGKLRFDINVLDYGTNTNGIVVKAESGPGVGTGDYVIDRVPTGTWTTLTIDIADLLSAPGNSGFNIDAFNTPFVILPAWDDQAGVHIQIDNVEWIDGDGSSETTVDAITDSFDIYADGAPSSAQGLNIGIWDNDTGHITVNTVADVDRGDVLQLDYSDSANNGVAFLHFTDLKNLSAFASEGQLVFDLKVLDFGSNTSGLIVKAESGANMGSGDYQISTPLVNVWTTYTIDIADLVAAGPQAGFTLDSINTPFVFLPAWGDQAGVSVQLDNIRWLLNGGSSSSASSSSSSSSSVSSSSVSSSSESSASSSSSVGGGTGGGTGAGIDTSGSAPTSLAAGWELVWNDEFNGASIDSDRWEHEVNCWGGGNNEAQCYTDSADNSYVADSLLHISAIYEGAGMVCGPSLNQEDPGYPGANACKDYSSARLRTRGKADWTYGRMEIRARVPQGVGVWPAIWMLPSDTSTYGGWPHSGELDIFEAFQPGVAGPAPTGAENEMHGTLHYGYSWPWNQYSGAAYEPPTNIWDDFYTYTVEWEEGEIRWYVNDVLFARNSGNWFIYYWGGQEIGYQVGTEAQPFDNPFHMILNVALGNGQYIDLPEFTDTRTMEVDYVRVYECSLDPVSGKGCETPTANAGVTPTNIAGHVPPPDTREELYLFQDGLKTLTLAGNEGDVQASFTPQLYPDAATVISNPEAAGPNSETVWDIEFTGAPASAFLTSDGGLNFGDNLHSRAKNLGELRFDLRVLDIEPGTSLLIKIDSVYPKVSYHEIEIPADVGAGAQWSEVAVRLWSLQPNTNEGYASPVDYTSINNAFVIEASGGTAHVQLNNIRLTCLDDAVANCDITPIEPAEEITEDMDIFVDNLAADWSNPGFEVYQQGGQVITIDATATDPDKGTVIEVEFTDTGFGTFYIRDSSAKDLSAFTSGNLVFDLKVVSNTGNTNGFVVKADCGYPCVGTEVSVPLPADNEWHPISVPISDINQGGFDITKVDVPFSLWPIAGEQNVTFQVDNIRWELAD